MSIELTVPKQKRENYKLCFRNFLGMSYVCLSYRVARELFERLLFEFKKQKRQEVYFLGDLESEIRYVAYAIMWIPIEKWKNNSIWFDDILKFLVKGESEKGCDKEFIERYCDEECFEECESDFCEEGYENCVFWCIQDMKSKCGVIE